MKHLTRRAVAGTAALALGGFLAAGCAHIPEDLEGTAADLRAEAAPGQQEAAQPAPAAPQQQPAEEAETYPDVTSPVRVTLDGVPELAVDQWGNYWNTERPVSADPEFVLTMSPELGDFEMLIINVHETDDEGVEAGRSWAITDFGGERVLAPDRTVNLATPEGASIIAPDGGGLGRVPLESGETYVVLFVVRGSEDSHTHKVRFTVR